jgi:hypothetical protein
VVGVDDGPDAVFSGDSFLACPQPGDDDFRAAGEVHEHAAACRDSAGQADSGAQGEPEQACVIGRQALDLTMRLSSARSIYYVRDLVKRLRPRTNVPAVRDFTAEVAERLPAAAGRAARR